MKCIRCINIIVITIIIITIIIIIIIIAIIINEKIFHIIPYINDFIVTKCKVNVPNAL